MKPSSRDDMLVRLGKHKIQTPVTCASIIGSNLDSMENNLEKALNQGAELVELRMDKLKDPPEWKNLLLKDVPSIVTNRSSGEGGYFEGSEKERIRLLLESINFGADCVDIELSTSKRNRKRILKAAEKAEASIIMSFHDSESVPPINELMSRAQNMVEAGCDLAKLVGFANNPKDALRMLDFLIKASDEIEVPVIAFSMGEEGRFTRLAAPLLGSPITYVSVGEKAAPGQLKLSLVKRILKKFWN